MFFELSFAHMLLCAMNFFRVDLCHQANDEEEDADTGTDNEENSTQQSLLDLKAKYSAISERGCRCCSFENIEVGSRQKFVIAVWRFGINNGQYRFVLFFYAYVS